MSGLRVSLAVEEGRLTALLPDGTTFVVPAALEAGMDDPGPALRQGLGRLEARLREQAEGGDAGAAAEGRVRLRVALLPPLSEVRLVELPPLRPAELDAVLQRNAPRRFLGRRRPLVVGGTRPGSDPAGPVVAAAVSAALVDALVHAIEARGWELERLVPAQAAWLEALIEGVPLPDAADGGGHERPVRMVVARVGDTWHLLRVGGDAPDRLRRLPAADVEGLVEAAGPEPGRFLMLDPAGGVAAEALRDAGWVRARAGSGSGTDDAATTAARWAARAPLELVPAALARTRRLRARRLTGRLVAVSVVLLVAAAAVHLWGVARDVRATEAARAEIRQAVAPALAARDSLDRLEARLDELRTVGRESARWTFSLVELSMLLPSDAHLISLRAAGDTLVIDAEARRAGDALDALRGASSLTDVRLEGVIQRQLEGGATSRERFTLSALLTSDGVGEVERLDATRGDVGRANGSDGEEGS